LSSHEVWMNTPLDTHQPTLLFVFQFFLSWSIQLKLMPWDILDEIFYLSLFFELSPKTFNQAKGKIREEGLMSFDSASIPLLALLLNLKYLALISNIFCIEVKGQTFEWRVFLHVYHQFKKLHSQENHIPFSK
jgi:hypothetical protein